MDLLIGVVVVVGLAAVVIAIAAAGRRQAGARSEAYASAAARLGLTHVGPDDGRAQRLLTGLGELSQFRYPSGAPRAPEDVIHGTDDGREILACWHATETAGGQARPWFLAIVRDEDAQPCEGLVVLRDRRVRRAAEVALDRQPVVWRDDPALEEHYETTSTDPDGARAILVPAMRQQADALSETLPVPADVLVRDQRTAVVTANRNDALDADGIVRLVEAARTLASARPTSAT